MSAPMAVKARSSVEIENSCNNCFCFSRKKHKKRSSAEQKTDILVKAGVMQIKPPEYVPSTKTQEPEAPPTIYRAMPSQTDLKAEPVKGEPAKFPI